MDFEGAMVRKWAWRMQLQFVPNGGGMIAGHRVAAWEWSNESRAFIAIEGYAPTMAYSILNRAKSAAARVETLS